MIKVSKRVIAIDLSEEDKQFFIDKLITICENAEKGRAALERDDPYAFMNTSFIIDAQCSQINRKVNELGTETFTANKNSEEDTV